MSMCGIVVLLLKDVSKISTSRKRHVLFDAK